MKVKSASTVKTPRRSPMEHPRYQYPGETAALQQIAHDCGLTEQMKWGKPCFTLAGKNIALIQRFNTYIALLFFKGALLPDPGKLLCRVGERMQAPRQLRFASTAEVAQLRPTIEAFLRQAIALEQSGARVLPAPQPAVEMPHELQARLNADPALRAAFAALTPGRQKAYLYRIAGAKRSATRTGRIEAFTPLILAGKGLHDRVRATAAGSKHPVEEHPKT